MLREALVLLQVADGEVSTAVAALLTVADDAEGDGVSGAEHRP